MNPSLTKNIRKWLGFALIALATALLYTAVQYAIRFPRQIPFRWDIPSPRTYSVPSDFSLVPRARIPLGTHSEFVSVWSAALNALTAPPVSDEPPAIPPAFSTLATTTDPGVIAPFVRPIIASLRDTLRTWGDRFLLQGEVQTLFLSSLKLSRVPESIHTTLWETFIESVQPYLEFQPPVPADGSWAPVVIPGGTVILRKGELVTPEHLTILRAIPAFLDPLPLSRWLLLFAYEFALFLGLGIIFSRFPGGVRLTHAPYLPRILAFYFLYPLLRFAASFSPNPTYAALPLVLMIHQADEWSPSFLPLHFFILHYASFLPFYSGLPVPLAQDMFIALITYLVFQFTSSNRLLYSSFTAGVTTYLAYSLTFPRMYEKIAYAAIVMAVAFVAIPAALNSLLDRYYSVLWYSDLSQYLRPTHPLLRKLSEKAPGTYAHSYRVAELASHAAEACGANPVLARAGALYHDIGKILYPDYFTENQESPSQNPHNDLSPTLSASIIRAHIIEGERLARQFRLPPGLIQFIRTHHGDQRISFFYEQALKATDSEDENLPPDESHFRYPGPRPQSAEEALVMLADSIEATVRAKNPRSEEELNAILEQTLLEKIRSDQLSETRLTLRQLHAALSAMKAILLGDRFRRIDYPLNPAQPVSSKI